MYNKKTKIFEPYVLPESLKEKARIMLHLDEGTVIKNNRHQLYKDSEGIYTVGYGRNIQHKGISEDEARLMFNNDLTEAVADSIKLLGQEDWDELGENQKLAVINMMFNLGFTRFSKFKNTLNYIKRDQYDLAAKNALLSKWAKQVKGRAIRVTNLIKDKITSYKF